ncbi:MAG TPA: DUF2490 domain-containing protein [Allosphingosinicella sp.]|nr:DUF2490 domain-containing protein [Allosphingosinicella sp.]
MRSILVAAALLLPASPAAARQTDEQLWLQVNAGVEISDRDKLVVESVGRFSDRAGGFFHAELGALFTHKTRGGVELSIGYRHVEEWDQGDREPSEERLRQMVLVPLGGGFNGRLRFEQRFSSAGSEIGFRLRPRLGFETPLNRHGLKLVATSEHFFNLNSTAWGQDGGYDRMRNTLGVSIPLGGSVRGEVGYLNQYRFGRDGQRDRMDHVATFTLSFTLARIREGE